MLRSLRLVMTCMAMVFSPGLAWASPVFPPASGIGLEPPNGMTVANTFTGFQRGQASILLNDFPKEAFTELNGARARFAATLEGAIVEDFVVDGSAGFVVRGIQQVDALRFRRWIVVLPASDETALVTVQVPLDDRSVTDEAVMTALRSIRFRSQPAVADQVSSLPFTVGDLAGFRIVRTVAGAVLGLTDGPRDVDPDATQPQVIVTSSFGASLAGKGQQPGLAREAFEAVRSIDDKHVVSETVLDSGGVRWAGIEATGITGNTRIPVKVWLFMRDADTATGIITVICTAPLSDPVDYTERFKRLVLSVSPARN